jgi:type II secretory pathway predicted ATPase ExeA
MYETFFGMNAAPFTNTIREDALFVSDALAETLGRLSYVAAKNMFAVVSGDVGVGKSTSIRKFVSSLDLDRHTVLYLADSKLTPRWFYKGLLDQLGIESKFYRGDAKRQLHRQLEIIRDVHHRTVVTVVDEAHLLDRETLEEIRFLLNFKMDSVNPMSLILVGQSELWDKLNMQAYKAIRQRIDIKCELYPYDRAETGMYVKAHLAYSGTDAEIFTDAAVDEIFKYSLGASRAINKVCTHALMSAAQRSKKLIDDHMVKAVVQGEMV